MVLSMKKLIIVLSVLALLITGCKATVTEQAEAPEVTATIEPTQKPDSKSRPIAVMIDNDDENARPHAGLDDAYIVYEMYVEGKATRIMALYKDVNTEKIGPVRSSRHYFLDYALENDAIYVHYGWSPQAQKDIASLGIDKINGVLGGDGNIFWRERKHKNDWHSAYTSIEKIMEYSNNKKKYRNTTDVSNFKKNYTDEDLSGEIAGDITIPYANFYSVSYKYNEADKTFKRYINGKPHKLQSGVHIAPKNIILQIAPNYDIPGDTSGRQDIKTVGTGEGYFITCGKVAKITWSKTDRKSKTIYKLTSGEEITLNPGQTWIQIVPASMALTIN